MNEVLLCSHNPILIKNLYGILREEGLSVETADHPSLAVQMVFKKNYTTVIIDPEPFGLSLEDAVKIIKTVLPGVVVIFVGCAKLGTDALNIKAPVDLEEFKRTIHDVHHMQKSI